MARPQPATQQRLRICGTEFGDDDRYRIHSVNAEPADSCMNFSNTLLTAATAASVSILVPQALGRGVPQFVTREHAIPVPVQFMEQVRIERPLIALDNSISVFIELVEGGVLSRACRAAVAVPVISFVVAGLIVGAVSVVIAVLIVIPVPIVSAVSVVITILVVIPVPIVILVLVIIATLGLPSGSHSRR